MAVRFGTEAVAGVSRLMEETAPRIQDLLTSTLPRGMAVVQPEPDGDPSRWLWHDDRQRPVGGWGLAATYQLVADPQRRHRLLATPPARLSSLGEEEQHEYLRRSVDLAMRGGATSGVVYPLAVCEIAREFRVRNVGGASAGAIAAAATAAAELGRSDPPPASVQATETRPPAGHLRRGYPGLSDLVSWMLQLDDRTVEPGQGTEQYRLAQLFRPVREQHDIFNVAVAVMRRRFWALPLALGWALSWAAKAALLVAAVLAVIGLGLALDCSADDAGRVCRTMGWGTAPVLLLGFVVVLAGLLSGLLLFGTWRRERAEARSSQLTPDLQRLADQASSTPAVEHARTTALLGLGLLVAALVLVVVSVLGVSAAEAVQVLSVGMAVVLVTLVLLVAVVFGWAHGAQRRFYGLLSGSTATSRPPRISRLVGAPEPSVDRPVVPWLSDSLAELAGLPGQVLCFGHLWAGRDFVPVVETADGSASEPEEPLRQLAASPGSRLVNLEMMTTDLSRRRPFRFPLDVAEPDGGPAQGSEALWFDPADLCRAAGDGRHGSDVLPLEVVQAMTAVTPSRTLPRSDGTGEVTLHRLPHPWNLPVVMAVRISMALPVLFTAVRLYRLLPAGQVRDDLGRTVVADGAPIPSQAHPCVAEPLWWSDGGITSNFPVHLFDSYLPRWPSFGLNLGTHPPGQPHQDVWLPQDWTVAFVPAAPVAPGFTGILSAVLDSARNWRDTLQGSLPGFRSRVGWVRQHPSEGGVSLFMPRTTVAALALRGAVAGARLTRRYRDDTQWDRHRWLRLRVTAGTLEALRSRVVTSRPNYDELLVRGRDGLGRAGHRLLADPEVPPPPAWFPPVDEFWEHAQDGLDAMCVPPPDPRLTAGAPTPEPTLSQVPPT